jgi:hypothetical protein
LYQGPTSQLGEKLAQPTNLKGFVSGYDFSHTNEANKMSWGLAPDARFSIQ